MKDALNNLTSYRKFLESIPLSKYREELKDIKWVEQDLVTPLYPLSSVYEYYWEKKLFLNFDEWFDIFWKELNEKQQQKLANLKELVRAHRKFYDDKINGDLENKVYLGFKARMYRTWVSVLTQLDFCYMFLYVCARDGKDLSLESNAEMDATGIDARINNIGFQIAKISQRKEALKIVRKSRVIVIPYAVFDIGEFERKSQSPRVKDKSGYRNALKAFNKYFIRLDNGFVVFKDGYLKIVIDNIDDIDKLKKTVDPIFSELAGE